jgi:shikimate kinase
VGRRHIVLVGLPGAGKSSAGRILAGLLETSLVDLDDTIVRETGLSIPELFAGRGEPAFRDLERAAMRRALAEEPHVIAPGGGWAAQPGNIEDAEPRALLVYLSVTPEVAAARLAEDRDRPLLQGDPYRRLEQLLHERERCYRLAGFEVVTDAMTPNRVAEATAVLARTYAGW